MKLRLTRGNCDADIAKMHSRLIAKDIQRGLSTADRQQEVILALPNADFIKQMQRAKLAKVKETVKSNFGLVAEDLALLGGLFRSLNRLAEVSILARLYQVLQCVCRYWCVFKQGKDQQDC